MLQSWVESSPDAEKSSRIHFASRCQMNDLNKIVCNSSIHLESSELTSLPSGLVVKGDLTLKKMPIKQLVDVEVRGKSTFESLDELRLISRVSLHKDVSIHNCPNLDNISPSLFYGDKKNIRISHCRSLESRPLLKYQESYNRSDANEARQLIVSDLKSDSIFFDFLVKPHEQTQKVAWDRSKLYGLSCPITLCSFQELEHPTVVVHDGRTTVFEGASFDKMMIRHPVHPATRAPIFSSQVENLPWRTSSLMLFMLAKQGVDLAILNTLNNPKKFDDVSIHPCVWGGVIAWSALNTYLLLTTDKFMKDVKQDLNVRIVSHLSNCLTKIPALYRYTLNSPCRDQSQWSQFITGIYVGANMIEALLCTGKGARPTIGLTKEKATPVVCLGVVAACAFSYVLMGGIGQAVAPESK